MTIQVIDLRSDDIDCAVCGYAWSYSLSAPHYGIPVYEDEILPDDEPTRVGQAAPVCPRCYFIVRGMQHAIRGRLLIDIVKKIATTVKTGE